jgi:hypothetical protein
MHKCRESLISVSVRRIEPGTVRIKRSCAPQLAGRGLIHLGPRVEDQVIQDLGENAILRRPPGSRIVSCTCEPVSRCNKALAIAATTVRSQTLLSVRAREFGYDAHMRCNSAQNSHLGLKNIKTPLQ